MRFLQLSVVEIQNKTKILRKVHSVLTPPVFNQDDRCIRSQFAGDNLRFFMIRWCFKKTISLFSQNAKMDSRSRRNLERIQSLQKLYRRKLEHEKTTRNHRRKRSNREKVADRPIGGPIFYPLPANEKNKKNACGKSATHKSKKAIFSILRCLGDPYFSLFLSFFLIFRLLGTLFEN